MKPGVSTSDTIGRPEASQRRMKRAALSAASASIAPPRRPDRSRGRRPAGLRGARTRSSSRGRSRPRSRAPSARRARVDRRAHGIDAQAVLRDRHAQRAGRRPPVGAAPWKKDSNASGDRRASASSSPGESTTPLRVCTSSGPIASGGKHAEAAAFDHRRTAHADIGVLGRDNHVAASRQARRCRRSSGRRRFRSAAPARQPGEGAEGRHVEPRDDGRRCRPDARRRLRRTRPPAGATGRRPRSRSVFLWLK